MPRTSLLLFVLFGTLYAILAAKLEEDPRVNLQPSQSQHETDLQVLSRQKRFTCDVLGFMGPGPCIAHCLALGRRGGFCNRNKICICKL